jgi:hypothetical protein
MKAIMAGAFMALSVAAAGAAEVDYFSAKHLLPACKAIVGSNGVIKSSNLQKAHDVGFCSATLSTLFSLAQAQMLDDQLGCMEVPPEVPPDQLAQIVVRYIEARPQRMQEPLIRLALEAFRDAWPCTPSTDFDNRFRGK